jgi:hypothetical protein
MSDEADVWLAANRAEMRVTVAPLHAGPNGRGKARPTRTETRVRGGGWTGDIVGSVDGRWIGFDGDAWRARLTRGRAPFASNKALNLRGICCALVQVSGRVVVSELTLSELSSSDRPAISFDPARRGHSMREGNIAAVNKIKKAAHGKPGGI